MSTEFERRDRCSKPRTTDSAECSTLSEPAPPSASEPDPESSNCARLLGEGSPPAERLAGEVLALWSRAAPPSCQARRRFLSSSVLEVVQCGSREASLVHCGALMRGEGLSSSEDEPMSEARRSSDRSTLRVDRRPRLLPGLPSSELSVSTASISWRCMRVDLEFCTGLPMPVGLRYGG